MHVPTSHSDGFFRCLPGNTLHAGSLPDAPLLHPLPHDGQGLRCPSACPPRLRLWDSMLHRKAGDDVQAHAQGKKPAERW